MIESQLFTITVALPAGLDEEQAGRFATSLGEDVISTSLLRTNDPFHGPWRLQWLVDGAPDRSDVVAKLALIAVMHGVELPEPAIERLPEINWLEHSYQQFPPFTVGPFFVYGSHYEGEKPAGQIPLQIDAATAFGSGEHGTTSGCLILLDQLKRNGFMPGSVLDMGCGSGILSIAARKIWDCPVTAVDIDPESVRVTNNHAAANGVSLMAMAGDGFAVVDSDYDLVIANILPAPLKAMARDVVRCTRPGGRIILSGMLLDQARDVLDVYVALGAKLEQRLDRGEWTALLLSV